MQGQTFGQYRVTGVLGRGGMGVVYAAEHMLLGRAAAVKVLLPEYSGHPEVVARFFNEARAASSIDHPGIIEIYDFGTTPDGAAFIVMEFLRGESLLKRLARRRLPWSTALEITRQIAGALGAAHAQGIVHRDLKPENVFLVRDPEVPGGERIKLLDFGIAKLMIHALGHQQTRAGSLLGTPTYMAPEQCRGVAVDARADLYALGCILFELCAGRPPFIGEGEGDVLAAHIYMPPPRVASFVSDVPEEVDQLIQRLLAKLPVDRPQTAEDVIRLVDAAGGDAIALDGAPTTHFDTTPGPGRAEPPLIPSDTTLSAAASVRLDTPVHEPRRWPLLAASIATTVVMASITLLVMQHAYKAPTMTAGASSKPAALPSPLDARSVQASLPAPASPTAAAPLRAPRPSPAGSHEPTTIKVELATVPAGATIVLDGTLLGQAPFSGTLPRAYREATLVFRLPGYAERRLVVRTDTPIKQIVKLLPESPPLHSSEEVRKEIVK
ncbi:MAG TPA: serine/threonine-protein kinase [Kofleriaceae bacterium]|nr:serine/threonine-protein kinase [Kofleriaceae bacterium]